VSVSDNPSPTPVDDASPQDDAAEPKATRSDRLKGLLGACWARLKRLAAGCWRRIRRGAGAGWRWIAERIRARWICMMKCIGDGCRLLNFLMFVNFISDFVYKRGFRFVGATVAVAILGYLSQWLPFMRGHYSARVAVLLPLMIGGSILALGLVLRLITNLLLAQLTNVAQAADLDLMEDYRKSEQQCRGHLESLWERVFRHEWAVGSAQTRVRPDPDESPPWVCSDEGAEQDPLGLGHFQFMKRAHFALDRAQPQTDQRHHLGIDLRFLEDWYNGGYFDREDRKLTEEYQASITLGEIKKDTDHGIFRRPREMFRALADLPTRFSQKYWFAFVAHSIGIQVGAAIVCLNRKYETDYFNAQAFLWPGQEDRPWLLEQFEKGAGGEAEARKGVRRRVNETLARRFRKKVPEDERDPRKDLLYWRARILQRVFGTGEDDVGRMLNRVVFPGFWFATRLRIRYDPEYLDGSLGCGPVADLEAMGVELWQLDAARKAVSRAAADRRALQQHLRERNEYLLAESNAEALRAVRVAVHVNRQRLRTLLRRYAQTSRRRKRDSLAQKAAAVIRDVLGEKQKYTSRLVALRVHHELTRLHYYGYVELLGQLRRSADLAGS